jgi:hypothetical protein
MYVLVSVPNEAFHRVMTARALQKRMGVESSVYRNASDLLRRVERSFGGRVVLLDWSRRALAADIAVAGASGLAVTPDAVHTSSWTGNFVERLGSGGARSELTHPWFNHLHTVELTEAGTLLVASAGADLILELSPEGEVLWHWFGPEHGFSRQESGASSPGFDAALDYREIRRSTSERAMHVTSALPLGTDRVLAALFHQGQVIAIDRKTGDAEIVMSGLVRPHGIHRAPGGFIFSDTLGHRIVLLDESLHPRAILPFGTQWLQDTIVTSAGTYFTLENVHIDQTPDTGLANRIAEIDENGKLLGKIDVPADHRLFAAREISGDLAQLLIAAWGRSNTLDGWIWN